MKLKQLYSKKFRSLYGDLQKRVFWKVYGLLEDASIKDVEDALWACNAPIWYSTDESIIRFPAKSLMRICEQINEYEELATT
jgi:hypothetical protein